MAESEKPIRVLHLEDDARDAELVQLRLEADGVNALVQRAKNAEEYRAQLAHRNVDLILADFSLPGYDGLAALEAARALLPEVPLIFVSGAIGEERAIETLRRGALDYVLKDRLERLAPAIWRAMDFVRERRRRQEAEAERDRLLVSERHARELAEAANRMKDEFLAVVSHELRTPLNAILGWASLLATGKQAPGMVAKGLATIERNARVQSRLIEDLLDISRIIAGKLQLRMNQIPVHGFVSAAVEAIRPAATAKRITLMVDVPQQLELVGDADRLQQVVWNLVANAVKFTPAAGSVRVLAARDGEAITLSVTDTGIGIEPGLLPHVFDRFKQGDASAARHQGGLGLGLAIVRHLVELHGGSITAESAGAGQGARFVLRLPLRELDSAESRAPATNSEPASSDASISSNSLSGVHALVVEDNADTRELIAFVLRESGARVSAAASVPQALELLRDEPDVIVSDISMPEVDGYSFVRRVRTLPAEAGGSTPAIALTAFARELDRREAAAAGYQRHIAKPVVPAALVAAVAEVLASSRR
jgi:signal transduction histidine kinase